jgi:hypothetical protein
MMMSESLRRLDQFHSACCMAFTAELFYDHRTNVDSYPQVASLDAREKAAAVGGLG